MASSGHSALLEAERLLYGANIDHAERFAGAEGAEGLAMIVTMYGIEPDESLMLGDGLIWHKDGKRTIAKHHLNKRDNLMYQSKLAVGVRDKALIYGVRGDPWLMANPTGDPPYFSIAWAQLIAAAYEAMQRFPSSHNVRRIVEEGFWNAKLFNARMPDNVVLWMKSFHNEFNDGHGSSLMDWLTEWAGIRNSWAEKQKKSNITTANPRYHEIMVEEYKRASSSTLSAAIKGWSWLNEMNSVHSFIMKYKLLDSVHEMYHSLASIDAAKQSLPSELLKLWFCVKGSMDKHVRNDAMKAATFLELIKYTIKPDDEPEQCLIVYTRPCKESEANINEMLSLKLTGSKSLSMTKEAIDQNSQVAQAITPDCNDEETSSKKKKS